MEFDTGDGDDLVNMSGECDGDGECEVDEMGDSTMSCSPVASAESEARK